MVGTLKGYDQLMNLVLDDVKELMRGTCPSSPFPFALHFPFDRSEEQEKKGPHASRKPR